MHFVDNHSFNQTFSTIETLIPTNCFVAENYKKEEYIKHVTKRVKLFRSIEPFSSHK